MVNQYKVMEFKCQNGDLNAGVTDERTGAAVYWGDGDTEAETWSDARRVADGLNRGETLDVLTPNVELTGLAPAQEVTK